MRLPGEALRRLPDDTVGGMAIETALVAPLLALLALGTFDVGRIVSQQNELQHVATQAEQIVLALPDMDDLDEAEVEQVIRASAGLQDAEIDIVHKHRCGVSPLQTGVAGCAAGVQQYKFIEVRISKTSHPTWTTFGVGGPITHTVNRTVQVG